MGRPHPGVPVVLVDPFDGTLVDGVGEDEICLDLSVRSGAGPLSLMTGYQGDETRNAEAMAGGFFHTGDLATRDEDGHIIYVGRTDDVFKASDYKVSPFELESVLIEHPAVAEAAVVPAPDPVRLAVPKAYVALCRDMSRRQRPRSPSFATPASTWLPTSGCGDWNSTNCRRRSQARFAGSSCGGESSKQGTDGQRGSTATATSPISRTEFGDARQSCRQGCLSPHPRYFEGWRVAVPNLWAGAHLGIGGLPAGDELSFWGDVVLGAFSRSRPPGPAAPEEQQDERAR